MSVLAPLLTRQRVFACKAETTTGTAEALTNAEAAYNAMDADCVPEFVNTERPGQSSLSQLPSVPGAAGGRISLRTELFGSGDNLGPTPAWADTLLAAAGFLGATNVYKPKTGSTSYTTLTAAVYKDGLKQFLAGCSANFTLTGEYGKPCVFAWDLLGVWQAPVDAAILAPTYPTVIPPKMASVAFTVGGTSFQLTDFALAMNNELYLRQDGRTGAAYLAACIPNRKPTLSVGIEASLLATHDWYADHAAGTERAVSLAIGSTAGNTVTIAVPKGQLMEAPKTEDAGGTVKYRLAFQCNRNAAAGDDELSLTFS